MSLKSNLRKRYETNDTIKTILFIPVSIYRWFAIHIRKPVQEYFYAYKYYKSLCLYKLNHLTIGIKKLGEKNTKFPHPIGIVIGLNVVIGENCTVYQNVTIGAKSEHDAGNGIYPQIGNNVTIGCNSVIIGDIKIGDNVKVGASTLVNRDIPNNATVVGNPCRIIS